MRGTKLGGNAPRVQGGAVRFYCVDGGLYPHGGGLRWAEVDVEAGCAGQVAGPGATEEAKEHGSRRDSISSVRG